MPLVQTRGAASAQGFGEFSQASAVPNYIEDVFSCFLYTGNSTTGGTQTITNSIDLSTKGGLVWIKGRSAASNHILTDTSRGAGTTASNNQALSSNLTTAEDLAASYDFLSAFNTTGFAVTQGGTTTATRGTNYNAVTYASWTFRKQPKFFDVVTYTGTGSNTTIAHNLGSVPACIMVKRTDTTGAWQFYHRSLANTEYLVLNTTAAKATGATRWNSTTPTSTVFSLGTDATVNASGGTYVAYIFAHNAGGFGLTGTDNVISCGSFATNGSGVASVNLGFEPQWLLFKSTVNSTFNWYVIDNMRGWTSDTSGDTAKSVYPNVSDNEQDIGTITITPTGFTTNNANIRDSDNYIYIAIRRGPMKVPTVGTSVFGLSARTGTGANATVTGGAGVSDAVLVKNRGSAVASLFSSRLTGTGYLVTSDTAAEVAAGTTILQANPWDVMDGVKVGSTSTITNASANTFINYLFKRAPSVFDVVCYTGTGANRTVAHNLAAVPELMIVKRRSAADAWAVYFGDPTDYLRLNDPQAAVDEISRWNDTSPTSTVFTVGTDTEVNTSSITYVAYLFATCAGVSKVGSFSYATGSSTNVDCGFTSGARFVMIKQTDGVDSWYVFDTARGIVAGNDPFIELNSSAAENSGFDVIDPYSAGFTIPAGALGTGTFIFLAIA